MQYEALGLYRDPYEKFLKNFQKSVDKPVQVCYTIFRKREGKPTKPEGRNTMYGIESTCDGGFTWELFEKTFATEAEAVEYMKARDWDMLAVWTYGEEGARVVAL